MKKFLTNKKELIFLCLIIILASFTRLWMLGKVPMSLSDDEIREVMSAFSLFHTGRDLYGHLFPLTFNIDAVNFGPVSVYISSLFLFFSDLGIFIGRFPYALFSIFSVLLVYFASYKISSNKIIALLSAFTMAISVWHNQISRVAYDPSFSMFFYLLGINFFLRIKKNNYKNLLLSMLFMILGFYCYAATKIIFLPFMMVLLWYKFKDLNRKQLLAIIFLIVFTFLSFAFLAKTQNAAQYGRGAFFFQDNSRTSLGVELERREMTGPNIIKTIYHNKITFWYKIFINQYFYAFSPEFLFTQQEASGIFSLWNRGELYIFESALMIMGIGYLFLKKRKSLFFILLMLLSSALPSGIGMNTPTYVIRSELMIPFLYILVGTGIFSISQFVKNNKVKLLIYFVLTTMYIYSFGGYIVQYYYSWSTTHLKYYSKSTQDLVWLINKEKVKEKEIIIGGATDNTFLQYAFYNKIDAKLIQKALKQNPIRFENITFNVSCLGSEKIDPKNIVSSGTFYAASTAYCPTLAKADQLIRNNDESQEIIWKIYIK